MYIWLLIVPLLAKILSEISGLKTLKIFEDTFRINLSLPFTWQVFYFSAFFFTVGNLIFYFRCPRLIQDYKIPSEFSATGKQEEHFIRYVKDLGISSDQYQLIKAKMEVNISRQKSMTAIGDIFPHMLNELFWHFHGIGNTIRYISLWIAAIAYLFGSLLISYVFIQNLHVVLSFPFPFRRLVHFFV